jgi:hypothetical protein
MAFGHEPESPAYPTAMQPARLGARGFRAALTSAANPPYVFQIIKMFFAERKTKTPLAR